MRLAVGPARRCGQADLSVRSRRPLAGSRRRAWAAAFAARAAAEAGQPDTAAKLLGLASATYDRPDDVPGWSSWLPWAAGAMAALAGDPAAGHDLLDQAAGRLRAMEAATFEAVVLVDATEAAVAAGRRTPPSPTRGGSRSSAARSKGS